jgi:hypothetical protein
VPEENQPRRPTSVSFPVLAVETGAPRPVQIGGWTEDASDPSSITLRYGEPLGDARLEVTTYCAEPWEPVAAIAGQHYGSVWESHQGFSAWRERGRQQLSQRTRWPTSVKVEMEFTVLPSDPARAEAARHARLAAQAAAAKFMHESAVDATTVTFTVIGSPELWASASVLRGISGDQLVLLDGRNVDLTRLRFSTTRDLAAALS